jgi:hypothetical protein
MLHPTMSTRQFDDFDGDKVAYLGYLYLKVANVPIADLISKLEGQLAASRRVQPQTPSHPSGQSGDDEGQTQRQYESRVGNPRKS